MCHEVKIVDGRLTVVRREAPPFPEPLPASWAATVRDTLLDHPFSAAASVLAVILVGSLLSGCGYFPVLQTQPPISVVQVPPGAAAVTDGRRTRQLETVQCAPGAETCEATGSSIVIVRPQQGVYDYGFAWPGGWVW